MGSTAWSTRDYEEEARSRARTRRPTFEYHAAVSAKPVDERTAHELLDPRLIKGKRESRDSALHPNAFPVAVSLDVTGSMELVPRATQDKLPTLMDFLIKQGVPDPQLMVAAVGDANSDAVPLQVSQFESGNEIDAAIRALYLEGGGGGSYQESYELFLYTLARKVVTSHWEVRHQKGVAFIIGDEHAYPAVKREQVAKILGDTIQADIPLAKIIAEVKERWEVFFIIPTTGTYHGADPELHRYWRNFFGQNVLLIDKMEAIPELIAVTTGDYVRALTIEEGTAALASMGVSASVRASVSTALAHRVSSGTIARTSGGALAPNRDAKRSTTERL